MRSPKSKMPKDYRQKDRERRRNQEIRVAALLGGISRHQEDPEGSKRWVQTGKW